MEEGKLRRVKVDSILSVVSSTPVEFGKIHKLTLLDEAMSLHSIHVVFYYTSNPFNDGPMSTDLENIRDTFSNLLDLYHIVTGRLTRGSDGGWQVKCNDAGVRMLQASVSTTLDEWLRSADMSEERDLTVWEDMPQDPSFWSPFRIQISNFQCGGLAIGLSCTHMLADITSATLLINSLAELHSGKPLTHSPIFHLPPHKISTHQHNNNSITLPPSFAASNHTNNNNPPKMGTATMKFSASAIQKCLKQAQNHCPNATPFDVLVALFWSRIACWQQQSPNDQNHKRSLCLCIDSRNKQGRSMQMPYGYFGNGLQFSVLNVDADKLLNDIGLGQVCDYVHRHIVGLKGEDYFSAMMSWLEDYRKEGKGGGFRIFGPQLTCISTEHMVDGMYGAVFNKGEKPVHVSYRVGNVLGEGLIMVMPSPEGGVGRIVTVTLPVEQIDNLCKDQAILDLEPTYLVSGRR